MRNLEDATERICELKGNLVALDALISALLGTLSTEQRVRLGPLFEEFSEAARTALIHSSISEHTVSAFERDVARTVTLLDGATAGRQPAPST